VDRLSKNKLVGIIVACTIAIIAVIVLVIPPLLQTPTQTPAHTLSVSISPPGAGSVSPSSGEYESGAEVTLIASPASGYTFDHWSGGASGTASTITITMDSNKSLIANFKATTQTYTLTTSVSPSGAGSVSPSGGQYESGVSVTLIATPASGYTFDYWSGSASVTTSTITVTMNSDKSLTANFKAMPAGGTGLPNGWETYNNEEYEFQFYYPGTWSEIAYPGATVAIGEPLSGTFQHNVNVVIEPTTLTLKQYIPATKQALENLGFTILSEDDLIVSGRSGHEWVMTKDWSTAVTKQRQVIFIANGNAYILTCSALVETYSSYTNTFDTIVKSFLIRTTATATPTSTPEVDIEYSATTTSQLNQFETAGSGNVYLILDLDIENKGYDSFTTNPVYFYVVVNNVRYGFTGIENQIQIVDLLNGGKISGEVAFEVPQNVMSLGYQPIYDTGWQQYNVKWIKK
jgi:hypothetical protein